MHRAFPFRPVSCPGAMWMQSLNIVSQVNRVPGGQRRRAAGAEGTGCLPSEIIEKTHLIDGEYELNSLLCIPYISLFFLLYVRFYLPFIWQNKKDVCLLSVFLYRDTRCLVFFVSSLFPSILVHNFSECLLLFGHQDDNPSLCFTFANELRNGIQRGISLYLK